MSTPPTLSAKKATSSPLYVYCIMHLTMAVQLVCVPVCRGLEAALSGCGRDPVRVATLWWTASVTSCKVRLCTSVHVLGKHLLSPLCCLPRCWCHQGGSDQ